MSDRQWCPSHWVDEVVAVVADKPDDCIRLVDGRFLLVDDEWMESDGIGGQSEDLTPGEVVKWSYSETLGRVTVVKEAEGTFEVVSGEMPEKATHWWLPGDPDTMADSLEDFVRDSIDGFEEEVEVEPYLVVDDIPLRFEVVDGEGQFVRHGLAS